MRSPIRIGARGSQLSRFQANAVAQALTEANAGIEIEMCWISTIGDRDRATALSQFGGVGVFAKEIEAALVANEVDIAVHSLKDLPTASPEGLTVAAIMERADPRDALVNDTGLGLNALPPSPRIGTGSLRRGAQMLALRPDATIVPIRGNVETRLRKVKEDGLAAVILAAAGLTRLGLTEPIAEYLDPERYPHAPGQGAVAVECRADDEDVLSLLALIDHRDTHVAVLAEREGLRTIEGGCQAPFGVSSRVEGDTIYLTGCITSPDGKRQLRHSASGGDPVEVGRQVAQALLDLGARDLLDLVEP